MMTETEKPDSMEPSQVTTPEGGDSVTEELTGPDLARRMNELIAAGDREGIRRLQEVIRKQQQEEANLTTPSLDRIPEAKGDLPDPKAMTEQGKRAHGERPWYQPKEREVAPPEPRDPNEKEGDQGGS